jgi:hypothetical protein
MDVLYTESAKKLAEWKQILRDEDIPFQEVMEKGAAGIKTTPPGLKLIRERDGYENTITPQMRKEEEMNRKALPYLGVLMLIFIGLGFVICSDNNAEAEAAAMAEAAHDPRLARFEIGTPFFQQFTEYVKREAVRNPRTFEVEDYRMLTYIPDSMVLVLEFSAENDFGVRTDHSITVVTDNQGAISRVVSAQ